MRADRIRDGAHRPLSRDRHPSGQGPAAASGSTAVPGGDNRRRVLLIEGDGDIAEVDTRSIDAHIRRLRLKLGPARHHVETVVGLGYRFVK